MFHKCVLMFFVCMCMKCFCVSECSNKTDTKTDKSRSLNNLVDPPIGYKIDEVTQGVGYGHHLHPFYFRGRNRRFYNCAVEEEWTPYEKDKEITLTVLPMVKNQEKGKITKIIHRIKAFPKKYIVMKRNDRSIYYDNSFYMNPHTKFIKDINSLSETSEQYPRYVYETQIPQLVVPDDADILIVKKRPISLPYVNPIENVIIAPPSYQEKRNIADTLKASSSNIVNLYKHPNSYVDNMGTKTVTIIKPTVNNLAQEVNKASHPYKFVTPSADDKTRMRFKKPQIMISQHQPITAPPKGFYKTKRLTPSAGNGKQSLWDKIVNNFLKVV